MKHLPLYSTRIIRHYLEYVALHYPEIEINSLIDGADITPFQLEDDGHWLTQDQVDRFHKKLAELTQDPNLPREAGRTFAPSKSSGVLSQYALGFITPGTAYAMLDKLFSRVTRAHEMTIKYLAPNSIKVIVTPKVGVEEKPYQCENRFGTFESIASLFTGKLAQVEHPTCIHRGDEACTYIISWEQPRSFVWKRIRNYGSLVGVSLFLASLFILPHGYVLVFLLAMALLITAVFLYTEKLEKQEISTVLKNQSILAEDLLDQINVSYENSLLVQEIGQAASEILNGEKILEHITGIMSKHLRFKRGIIFVADREEHNLVYAASYGFCPELFNYLKSITFHLGNPASKGEMVRAFREQKPFMVNDTDQIRQYLSKRTKEFVDRLGIDSFICVPIVHEGRSVGVLAVDAPRFGKSPNQSDVNLIMGIATQIGSSLNSVRFYQEIKEREALFRNLSESIPDIIVTVAMNGEITYVNPAVAKVLGYAPKDIIGAKVMNFVKKDSRADYLLLMKRIHDSKDTVKNFKGTLIRKDGAERLFDINCVPNLDGDGDIKGLVANLKDITEQHSLEAQLHHASKMEAIGTLTGGISHDFNNILQALRGYTQLLLTHRPQSDRDRHYLVSIDEMIERATNLTRQLLLFSRKVESKFSPFDFNQEIKKCFDILSQTITRMITIELKLADDLGIVNGDATQMGQIIMNLALNARDAMPEGGRLAITTENVQIDETQIIDDVTIDKGTYVRITVSDTGTGMTQEVRERIFEPFFTTKDGKGTGLGLPVVYGIVTNHGGTIACHSEPDSGSTFTVYLPRIDAPRDENAVIVKAAAPAPALNGSETVLIVDDEEMLLETGEAILDQYGYTTCTARSGEEALEYFALHKDAIDLILLDLIMPGMGGQKCLEGLLKIDPSVPVVITSGYTAGIDAQEILQNGATGFINKPYQVTTLIQEIRTILDCSTRNKDAPAKRLQSSSPLREED